MIKAKLHSDDNVYQFEFDATDWFLQATDEEIAELVTRDYGGMSADRIVLFFEDRNTSVGILLDYCRSNHSVGFECHIDEINVRTFVVTENTPEDGDLPDWFYK